MGGVEGDRQEKETVDDFKIDEILQSSISKKLCKIIYLYIGIATIHYNGGGKFPS